MNRLYVFNLCVFLLHEINFEKEQFSQVLVMNISVENAQKSILESEASSTSSPRHREFGTSHDATTTSSRISSSTNDV